MLSGQGGTAKSAGGGQVATTPRPGRLEQGRLGPNTGDDQECFRDHDESSRGWGTGRWGATISMSSNWLLPQKGQMRASAEPSGGSAAAIGGL
jgi:hypothetical protein